VLALAETRSLATFADSVLLIARWRATPKAATHIALDTLRSAGADVDGVVLTFVD
jgi:Mrp family chromosome partitioning ATPase